MMEALQKVMRVVTAGGVVGKVVKLDENYVTLQVSGTTEISFQRNAVTRAAAQPAPSSKSDLPQALRPLRALGSPLTGVLGSRKRPNVPPTLC